MNRKIESPSLVNTAGYRDHMSALLRFLSIVLRSPSLGKPGTRKLGARRGVLSSANTQFGKMALSFMLSIGLLLTALFTGTAAMQPMQDAELAGVTGQALMQMAKTPGGGISSDITFYRAGLDAALELNLNIDKLQLGCGGVRGPGCDIDIDHLSLSGAENCPGGRPNCSAVLTRPFFEFAIKNDDKPGLREVIGIRMSAEKALGLLTAGYQDESMGAEASKSGINSLSGYMALNSATGTGTLAGALMCRDANNCDGQTARVPAGYDTLYTNTNITGRVRANIANLGESTMDYTSTNYGLLLQPASATFTTAPITVSGNRMTSVALAAVADVGAVSMACPPGAGNQCVRASAAFVGIPLNLHVGMHGQMTGLKAAVTINQSLSLIHKIPVDNPFSLSMQSANVLWPGAESAAEQGWWMAFEDAIDIGSVSPSDPVHMTSAVLQQAIPPVNTFLHDNPVACGVLSGGEACFGGNLGPVHVNLNNYFSNPANHLQMQLSDLKLSAQSVTPNCWGNARFC